MSVTQTFETRNGGRLKIARFQWSGSASLITGNWTSGSITRAIQGTYLVMAVAEPGPTTPPADNYDVTILESGAIATTACDVMGGELTDLNSGSSSQHQPRIGVLGSGSYAPRLISSALQLNITNNAVANSSGCISLYFVDPADCNVG